MFLSAGLPIWLQITNLMYFWITEGAKWSQTARYSFRLRSAFPFLTKAWINTFISRSKRIQRMRKEKAWMRSARPYFPQLRISCSSDGTRHSRTRALRVRNFRAATTRAPFGQVRQSPISMFSCVWGAGWHWLTSWCGRRVLSSSSDRWCSHPYTYQSLARGSRSQGRRRRVRKAWCNVLLREGTRSEEQERGEKHEERLE